MALVSLSFSVCVMIVCWPQLSSSDNACPCPEIPKWNLTNLPQQPCFKINDNFRYKCKDGYLRKAGTSNLIKCKNAGDGAYWSEPKPKLECIRDPRITTTQPPNATTAATTTESHADISHYAISTPAITTASTTQTMPNASTALEQGTTTQTTTHEPVIETTGKTETNATVSPRRNDNTTSSMLKIDATTTTAATVAPVLLVVVCTAVIVLLYRRRQREHTPVYQEPEEMCSLNA